MRADAFRGALGRLPLVPPATLTRGEPFLVLSPHPDDESLGCGGLIAAACAAGSPPHVAILTDGAGSHPRSRAFPPPALVALRQAEAALAAARLGLPAAHLHPLGLPDTRAPVDGPAFDETVARLEALLAQAGARRLLVTWGRDPHCDHEAAEALARALRRRVPGLDLWAYPIWGWHRDAADDLPDPAPDGYRLDIAPWLAEKRAAIAAHRSQMTDLIADDPEGFRFTPATLAPFLAPVETVFRVPA